MAGKTILVSIGVILGKRKIEEEDQGEKKD